MSDKTNHNPEGQKLSFHFNIITNVLNGQEQFKAELILTNYSPYPLNSNWSIYFNFLRMIIPGSVSKGFEIKHINGDYFSLEPTEGFIPLAPNTKVTIEFTAKFWAIKNIDAPAGFYIVYRDHLKNDLKPEAIPPVSIGAFNRPEQSTRTDKDILKIPTSESRFNLSKKLSSLPKSSLTPIMPTPVFFEKTEDLFFSLNSSSHISYESNLKNEALFLSRFLSQFLGKELSLNKVHGAPIRLSTSKLNVGTSDKENSNSEAYNITINNSGIELIGASSSGVFYAIQSLIQLMDIPINKQVPVLKVPFVHIQDKPQFAYRGMHLDVARNFQKTRTIKKMFDMMSFYKLNKFHFHLTDDEGWRIEIPDLPELTEVGSRRGHTYSETNCLLPSYGSGFDSTSLNASGNGFYSREEFIELLQYAHERHIEVIPAIDFPGHARAAVRAMEVRFDHFKALGDYDKANEYLLTDWNDTSEYISEQMWKRNVVNIGLPSTYKFIEKIIDELLAMYVEAHVKLSIIHIGGDEVPVGSWLKSPACQKLIDKYDNLKDIYDLSEYFIRRVNSILATRGLKTAGWEEIILTHKNGKVEPNPSLVNHQITPYTWNTIWGQGGEEIPYKLANLGYKVVLSNAPNLYFDLAYDKDPEESGYYWAGYTDTEDTFKFLPMNFFKSAEKDGFGNSIDPTTHYKNAEHLTEKGKQNILGIQGQLWGETIRTEERIEYLLFPRMCALAERAWSTEPNWAKIEDPIKQKIEYQKDWNQFVNRLGKLDLPRLDHLFGGVSYRIPLPGAIIQDNLFNSKTSIPGLTIRYTTDGKEPTIDSPIFEEAIKIESPLIKLKTFTSNGRSSRTALVKNKVKFH